MTTRIIAALFALFTLTGCATAQPAIVVTATPAPGYAGPMPTYADPAKQVIVVQNTADALYALNTQQAMMQRATEAAATQAAADAQAAVVQVTAQAIAAAATATAGQISLQRAIADVTATSAALRMADTVATQEAARAADLMDAQRAAAEGRARDKTVGDALALIGLGVLGILALGVLVAVEGVRYWIKNRVAVNVRRELVMVVPGVGVLQFDPDDARWQLLRGAQAPPPELPEVVEERPRVVINRRAPLETPAPVDAERAQRDAWRDACRRFLLWGEAPHPDDGQPAGYSMRRWRAVTGGTLADWSNSKNLLLQLGILVSSNGSYALRDGMDAARACHLPVWATSFEYDADVKVSEIPDPSAIRDATYSTAQDATARQNAVYASSLAVPFDLEGEPMD